MEERPYPNPFPDVTLTEATEEDRTWYLAKVRCPVCSMLIMREHRTPVGAETVLLRAVEEHQELAHGV